MKNIISKLAKILSGNLEQKCLKLKEAIKKEKIENVEIEKYILQIEIEIQNADAIIKIEELLTIPLFLATFGVFFSSAPNNLHKWKIFWVVFLVEIVIIAWIYFKSYHNKFYAEKMLEYYKEKLK